MENHESYSPEQVARINLDIVKIFDLKRSMDRAQGTQEREVIAERYLPAFKSYNHEVPQNVRDILEKDFEFGKLEAWCKWYLESQAKNREHLESRAQNRKNR